MINGAFVLFGVMAELTMSRLWTTIEEHHAQTS
jgi:hypothetical protein